MKMVIFFLVTILSINLKASVIDVEIINPLACDIQQEHVARLRNSVNSLLIPLEKCIPNVEWRVNEHQSVIAAFNEYVSWTGLSGYLGDAQRDMICGFDGLPHIEPIDDVVRFMVLHKSAVREAIDREGEFTVKLDSESGKNSVFYAFSLTKEGRVRTDTEWNSTDSPLLEHILLSRAFSLRAKLALVPTVIMVNEDETIDEAISRAIHEIDATSKAINREMARDDLYVAGMRLQMMITVFKRLISIAKKDLESLTFPDATAELLALDFVERYDPEIDYQAAYAKFCLKTLADIEEGDLKSGLFEFVRNYIQLQSLLNDPEVRQEPYDWVRERIDRAQRERVDPASVRLKSWNSSSLAI